MDPSFYRTINNYRKPGHDVKNKTELEPGTDWDVDGPSAVAGGSSYGFQGRWPHNTAEEVFRADSSQQEPGHTRRAEENETLEESNRGNASMQKNNMNQGRQHIIGGALMDWEDNGDWPEHKA